VIPVGTGIDRFLVVGHRKKHYVDTDGKLFRFLKGSSLNKEKRLV
jgi:hypothetical protein